MDNKKIIQMDDFLNQRCMEYAKYTITDRAIPDLRDGCKPIHRRLVYSMYLDKLTYDKNRTKSAKACSSVMRLSPHGDTSVYGACVRLANDSVNIPVIDGKGAFSSINLRDVQPGAMRYTEVRLAMITKDMLNGIDKKCVPFKPNYDDSMLEPTILPVAFPLILANPNKGIAVGVASTICGYNFQELCENTAKVMLKQESSIMYPDFSTGGFLVKDERVARQVHETGRGSFTLRGRYKIVDNSIIFTEIPYTTTVEQVEEEILKLIRAGTLKDVIDVNNYTGDEGLNITIDVKKSSDKNIVVNKLFKLTSLESAFNCNFTVLHNNRPCVLGVKDILNNWCDFRIETVRNILRFDKEKIENELNILKGLKSVLLDIDLCIAMIRSSDSDDTALLKLQTTFGLTKDQAEYISNMKLRNISKNNLEKQIKKIDKLEEDLLDIIETLTDENKLRKILAEQLMNIGKEYSYDRMTELIVVDDSIKNDKELLVDDYNCQLQISNEGYFKKTKLTGLKASTNKLKDGDSIMTTLEATNKDELLLFCEDLNVYKFKLSDLEETKLSNLGQYMYNETKSKILGMSVINPEYKYVLIAYKDGSLAKISLDSYVTKQQRKLLNKSLNNTDVFGIYTLKDDCDVEIIVSDGRFKKINTSELTLNKSRNSGGKKVMTWKKVSISEINLLTE